MNANHIETNLTHLLFPLSLNDKRYKFYKKKL